MIPFLPEMPALTLPPATPGTLPLAPAGESSGLDFAGLLGAVMPLPPGNGAAQVTITRGSVIPEDAVMPDAEVPALTVAPLLAERALPSAPLIPTGRNLPLPGVELPELVAATLTPAIAPDTPAALAPASAVLRRNVIETGDPVPTDAELPSEPTAPMKPAQVLASRMSVQEPPASIAEPIAELPSAPSAERDDAPVATDQPERDPEQPDAATAFAIAPLVQPAAQPAAAPTAAPDIVVAASSKRPLALRLAVAPPDQAAAALPAAESAAPPARPATALASAKRDTASTAPLPVSTPSAPAPPATPGEVVTASADPASPVAATPSAPPPIPTALAALAPTPTPAAAPERTDVRADTPAPQQQSTIDQVGDLREALRSARPAMTLQHAEFGAVSVRLEATATEGWRAVLASRDPGFVPAIQTALAERAVMAAAASPDSGGFMHHSGTGEHRSGSTPNGGQGASQPYLGQSGSRDGEAAPDHRRPSTAAALAARAEAEEAGSGSPGQGSGGLFA